MNDATDYRLLPCPFCGYMKPKLRGNRIGDFFVICDGDDGEPWCGASTSDQSCETRRGAVDRWNRRTNVSAETLSDLARVNLLIAMRVRRYADALSWFSAMLEGREHMPKDERTTITYGELWKARNALEER